jgi:hypothetical protein
LAGTVLVLAKQLRDKLAACPYEQIECERAEFITRVL